MMTKTLDVDFDNMTTDCAESVVIKGLEALIRFAEADRENSLDHEAEEQAESDLERADAYREALALIQSAPCR